MTSSTREGQSTLDRDGISFRHVTSAIGADVDGVDLNSELSDDGVELLRRAVHTHGVLFFHDQTIRTDDEQIAVMARFGAPYRHSMFPDNPVTIFDSAKPFKDKSGDLNTGWHTDASYEERPPDIAMLRPVELPAYGGDTVWASMTAVYESLPAPVQRLLEDLDAVHDARRATDHRSGSATTQVPRSHPVVIREPTTGRRAIYVNSNYTSHIVGLPTRESDSILGMLYSHILDPDCQVRFRWTSGAVAMWSERTTQHFGVGDTSGRRIVHRVIASGDRPIR